MPEKRVKVKEGQALKFVETCEKCRLPITAADRQGSFTGYLFRESRCKCSLPQPIAAPKHGEPTKSPTDDGRDPAGSGLAKPALGERYEVLELLGSGGMGNVWKVRDRKIDQILAVKVLRPELSLNKEAIARFEQEAMVISNLSHANIVGCYGYGVAEDQSRYIIMDYLAGESLTEIIAREGRMPVERVLNICQQLCEGLEYAHSHGLVHRDLKPSNVIVTRAADGLDIVKIVDFGIVKEEALDNRHTHNLTQSGDVFGSPNYMSPEQCLGFVLNSRSDLYSLGCLMFECLTGRPPFSGENPIQVIAKHLNEKPERFLSKQLNVPVSLEMVILTCLDKDPENRYASAKDLRLDLEAIAGGSEPKHGFMSWSPDVLARRFGACVVDGAVLYTLVWFCLNLIWTVPTFLFWGGLPAATHSIVFQCSVFFPQLMTTLPLYIANAAEPLDAALQLVNTIILSARDFTAAHHGVAGLKADDLLAGLFQAKYVVGIFWFSLVFILNWLYHAIMESSTKKSTFGERICGLEVIDVGRDKISFARATMRHFFKFITWFLVIDIARFVISLVRTKNWKGSIRQVLQQPAHEKLSGTIMVKRKRK